MKEKLQRFMIGRYGTDALNKFLLGLTFFILIVSLFSRRAVWSTIILLLIVICYFRMFSRNVQKRYNENMKYLAITKGIRGKFSHISWRAKQMKDYHIYRCPNCRQEIRIPRGKGKISITCPKCKNSFIKNS